MSTNAVVRVIIAVSWPGLFLGTALALLEARNFRRRMRSAALGRLVLASTAGWLLTLYCLGFVATSHLLRHGTADDIAPMGGIFLVSVAIFAALLYAVRRWNREAAALNDLYLRLEQAATDRTAELEKQNKRLQEIAAELAVELGRSKQDLERTFEEVNKVTRLMISREIDMRELKSKISMQRAGQASMAYADVAVPVV